MAEYRGPRWSALHLRDCVPALRTRCAGCLCLPMPSAPPVPGWDPQEEGPHACTEDTGSTMPRGVWLRGRVEGRVSSVPPSGGTVRLQPPHSWALGSALSSAGEAEHSVTCRGSTASEQSPGGRQLGALCVPGPGQGVGVSQAPCGPLAL